MGGEEGRNKMHGQITIIFIGTKSSHGDIMHILKISTVVPEQLYYLIGNGRQSNYK